mgnify:CR=1 FL=1
MISASAFMRSAFLPSALAAACSSSVAIVTSSAGLFASSAALKDPMVPVAPEIRAFLRNAEQRVVYVGLDRDRKVYRFE